MVGALIQRLMSQPNTQKDSSTSLKRQHDVTKECMLGLQACKINTDNWDPIIVHLLHQLMDRHTQMLWEQSMTNPREVPKLNELLQFLENRFQAMEVVGPNKKILQQPTNALIATTNNCTVCMLEHGIYQCPKFLNMSTKQRFKTAQNSELCVNCLKKGHKTQGCTSKRTCQKCNKRHNTLLHFDRDKKQSSKMKSSSITENLANSTSSPITSTATKATSLAALPTAKNTSVILSTVPLKVKDEYGNQLDCRAVLDNGSQVHLMTQAFAKKLGVQEYDHFLNIQGIGESQRKATRRVNVQLYSRTTSFTANIEAQILSRIVSKQPGQYINIENWKIPGNVQLADPHFNIPNEIDLLIGAGLFLQILSIGQIKLGDQLPTL